MGLHRRARVLPTAMLLPSSLLISSLFLIVAARPVDSAAAELRELTASDFSSNTKAGVWYEHVPV